MRVVIAITLAGCLSPFIFAQTTLGLRQAQELAVTADPRLVQLQLEEAQSELRLQNIAMERRPALMIQGQAQYQSETVEFPFTVPGGRTPRLPKDTYDAHVSVEHILRDPTRSARIAAERTRRDEAQARIRAMLFALRGEVNEAFFATFLLQERAAQLQTSITDLEARLREAALRVEQGVALRSEAASVEATLLQRRNDLIALRSERHAALSRLSRLLGREIAPDETLALPAVGERFESVRAEAANVRQRPEFDTFARMRTRLEAQKDLLGADARPRASAYGRAGVGKPGLNFLSSEFNPYYLAGLRLQWKPLDWGRAAREQKIVELQQEAVAADEAAFVRLLERSIQNDLAAVDRLRDIAANDDRIVTLREAIEQETRVRFNERVVTAAEYIDRESDALEARLVRASHRVELAQAQSRVLNVLGVEIP